MNLTGAHLVYKHDWRGSAPRHREGFLCDSWILSSRVGDLMAVIYDRDLAEVFRKAIDDAGRNPEGTHGNLNSILED